jgi:hypothetical protein
MVKIIFATYISSAPNIRSVKFCNAVMFLLGASPQTPFWGKSSNPLLGQILKPPSGANPQTLFWGKSSNPLLG